MSTGYILVLAVLLLGGIIATVGDRLGTRVGKARLSLFNLRPRKTATLVTILTGTVIAASTLGILFATSEYLREGLFQLDEIQKNLRRTRRDLQQAREQQVQVQTELTKAKSDRAAAQKQLAKTRQQFQETEQSLQQAITQRGQAESQRTEAEAARARTEAELSRTQRQLRGEINQLEAEKNRLINSKNQEIRSKEAQLRQIEAQQEFLAREVQKLELERRGLRQGNVAIQRGQILASAVIRAANSAIARQAVDQLLNEANRASILLSRPGANGQQVLQITKLEVDQLIDQIDDGQDYVVRILSAANYLTGEAPIQVFTDAVRNRVVFQEGDVVSATTVDPANATNDEIQQRINLLIAAANFRARNLGIQADSVEIGRIQDVIAFIEQLRLYNQPLEVKAVAATVTYVAGPLRIEFIASQNGRILFRTGNLPAEVPSTQP